ncbi:MAG: c-type cytochrome [Gammaproteobacteria bacterium]|nr:c-type cytochrome [Gammaproteobacteria bacterium]
MGVPYGLAPYGQAPYEAVPYEAVGVPYGAVEAVGVPNAAVEAVGVPNAAVPHEAAGVPYGTVYGAVPYGAVASTFVPPADRGPLDHAVDPPGAGRRKGVPSGAILLLLTLTAGCGAEPDEAEHPGKAVYQRYCYACHQAGIADAPKLGDKEAWAGRLEKTRAELVRNVKIGMPPGMPPRAGCASCSDEELEAAVDFMVLRAQ